MVIIGLIVGGILTGQDLIKAAQIRAQVTQFGGINTAIRTFKLKYNAIPGDMLSSSAVSFGLSSPSSGFANGGNGDGMINSNDYSFPINWLYEEPVLVFLQLSQAGLIEGAYSLPFGHYSYQSGEQFLMSKMGNTGLLLYSKSDGNLAYFWGLNNSVTDNSCPFINCVSTAGVITPQVAYFLDVKMDDGLPTTGHIRSATASNAPIYDTSDGICSTASTNKYNIQDTSISCRLIVDVQ